MATAAAELETEAAWHNQVSQWAAPTSHASATPPLCVGGRFYGQGGRGCQRMTARPAAATTTGRGGMGDPQCVLRRELHPAGRDASAWDGRGVSTSCPETPPAARSQPVHCLWPFRCLKSHRCCSLAEAVTLAVDDCCGFVDELPKDEKGPCLDLGYATPNYLRGRPTCGTLSNCPAVVCR